jgi:integrase
MKGHLTRGRVEGTWYLRFDLGRTPDGKRCQRRETFRGTKAEAERRLRARLTEIENGTAAAERLLMTEVVERWLVSRERQVGRKTQHRYRQIAEEYILPHLGTIEAEKLRPLHIEKALTSWRVEISPKTNRPLTDRSIRHNFDTLRALCRWATRMGLMGKNPCEAVTPPRWEQKEMSVLTPETLVELLAAAKDTELEIPIIIFVGTGLRRGEVFGLRWSDIDFDRRRLTVRRSIEVVGNERREKPPKTARSARTVALAEFVLEALRRQRREQAERRLALGLGRDEEGYVFDRPDGSPWDPELFGWRFAELVKRKGLPKVRLHDLRHSYATFMLAAGTDLKSISTSLGHSTIAVTANLYAHVTDSLLQEHANRLDAALGDLVGQGGVSSSETLVPQRCHTAPLRKEKPRHNAVPFIAPAGFESARGRVGWYQGIS